MDNIQKEIKKFKKLSGLINENTKTDELLNEGALTDFLVNLYRGFKRTVGSTAESLIDNTINSIAQGTKK